MSEERDGSGERPEERSNPAPPQDVRRSPPLARAAAVVEVAVAAGLFAWLVSKEGLRSLLVEELRVLLLGVGSAVVLSFTDPPTLLPAALGLVKAGLLLAPPIRALALSRRRRLVWVPLGGVVWLFVLPNAVPGVTGALMWALFLGAAGAAWMAVKRPVSRALAFLPWVVALEPLLGHSPLADLVWTKPRLAEKCVANDGIRPMNFRPEMAVTRHYSVTPVSPDLFLLAGERGSFWVRRGAGGARLGPDLRLRGNLWQGCIRDGKVWMAARGRVCEAAIPTGLDDEGATRCHEAPGPPEIGVELDYVDVLCPADRPGVLVTQLLRGGMLEVDPGSGATRWHPVMPGLNLQGVMRKDGRIVGITMSRLFVFDPGTDRVLEEQSAGILAMGIDICASDGAVVVADFTGRVRLFERAGGGEYRLRGGALVPAARRVAFSPSCERVVVTSGDDRRVYLLRRSDLEVLRSWNLGPGLRDVAFLDDRWAAAADACTVSLLDADAP